MFVASDPSGLVVAVANGTLSRFHPLGVMRLPRAVTKCTPTSLFGGRPVARSVVCECTGPAAGVSVAEPDA
ncbi:MAG: hypothetical protein E6J74_41985, partial [Deltaproteobacteria bacterium]